MAFLYIERASDRVFAHPDGGTCLAVSTHNAACISLLERAKEPLLIRPLICCAALVTLLSAPLAAHAQDAIGAINVAEKKQEVIDDKFSCAGGDPAAAPLAGLALVGVIALRRRTAAA